MIENVVAEVWTIVFSVLLPLFLIAYFVIDLTFYRGHHLRINFIDFRNFLKSLFTLSKGDKK